MVSSANAAANVGSLGVTGSRHAPARRPPFCASARRRCRNPIHPVISTETLPWLLN